MAQDLVPPDIVTVSPTGVNISDGSLLISETDLKIGSLTLDRTGTIGARNNDVSPPALRRWVNNFDIYVKETQRTSGHPPTTVYRAIVHLGNGASAPYDMAFNVSPILISPNSDDAFDGILELSGSSYVFTDQTGTVYSFAGSNYSLQQAASVVYPNGRKLTFLRDSSSRLKAVTSSDGYAIVFDYGSNGATAACGYNLSQTYVDAGSTCTSAALNVAYGYTSGALSSVTDTLGGITYYDTVSPVGSGTFGFCVRPPGYSACKVTSTFASFAGGNGANRVTRQDLADGSVWQFGGGDPSIRDPDYGSDDGSNSAAMTDPNGKITAFAFTKSSPYSITDANGKMSQYRFSGGHEYDSTSPPSSQGKMLMQAMLPEGNEYDASYNASDFNLPATRTWKAKPGSGLADRIETLSYPSCNSPNTRQNCVHPTAIVDARGNQTDYVYTSYGSIQSEMQPAPASGAARPLKLYTYVQKFAYIKNSGGSLVAAATPIWMPATELVCQTVAGSSTAACDPAAPRLQTSYEYGADGTADNLLLRGLVLTDLQTSVVLRTCYRYDTSGDRVSETRPRAGLAVCPGARGGGGGWGLGRWRPGCRRWPVRSRRRRTTRMRRGTTRRSGWWARSRRTRTGRVRSTMPRRARPTTPLAG